MALNSLQRQLSALLNRTHLHAGARFHLKIVVFAHFAGAPKYGMVYGHYYLGREWVRMGHTVTIIAASYAHTRFCQPDHSEETIDGIKYLFIKTPRYSPKSNLGRAVNILSFTAKAWIFHRLVQADIVICSSHHPFAIYAARACAKHCGARLVFEVRDLWPLTLVELGGVKATHPFIRMMQYSEDYAYRNADVVVSVLSDAKHYMVSRGLDPRKFVFIPNGVDLDAVVTCEPLPSCEATKLEALRSHGKFIVGYAGRIGLANALHTLIDAIALVKDLSVAVVILGDGSYKAKLQSQAKRLNLTSQVLFFDSVPKNQVGSFLSRIDVAYLGLQSRPLFRFGISPTKLNDYMLAGKPVICAVEASGNVMNESGAGISCRPESPSAVADAIKLLMTKKRSELAAAGEKGRIWIQANRSYKALAHKFIDAVLNSDAREKISSQSTQIQK